MTVLTKHELLLKIVELRSGLLKSTSPGPIEPRLCRFCDALRAWTSLPKASQPFYSKPILESVFALAADIEESADMADVQRWTVELSLWQAITDLNIDSADQRSRQFIVKRSDRLERLLGPTANSPVLQLLYAWTSLLRPRASRFVKLPGPFIQDASQVAKVLLDAGLPRRAKAVGNKFQIPLDPLIKWNIDNRPESEEISKTAGLLNKISAPSQPVPYRVFVCTRALQTVLSSPLTAIPIAVSTSGHIHIRESIFGGIIASAPTGTMSRTNSQSL